MPCLQKYITKNPPILFKWKLACDHGKWKARKDKNALKYQVVGFAVIKKLLCPVEFTVSSKLQQPQLYKAYIVSARLLRRCSWSWQELGVPRSILLGKKKKNPQNTTKEKYYFRPLTGKIKVRVLPSSKVKSKKRPLCRVDFRTLKMGT